MDMHNLKTSLTSKKIAFATIPAMFVLAAVSIAQVTGNVPPSAKEAKPITVGSRVPKVSVMNLKNDVVSLKEILNGKPTVIVFYRGGWCPYCVRQLADLAKTAPELEKMGFQIVGITPDTPEKINTSIEKGELPYAIYSDAKADAMKAFGVAFRLDDETFTTYKDKYGMNLEERSGETHHILPVPTVFLIDKRGKITFEYSNPDYSIRLKGSELLEAAKKSL